MIFVTVGTQLLFPRMLAMVEAVAGARTDRFLAQTADPDYAGALPSRAFMERAEFEQQCAAAEIIIAHAGMGTIFAARRHNKPLIVIPRRDHLGEHRNDHQYATAHRLRAEGQAAVAEDETELARALAEPPPPLTTGSSSEKNRLIRNLRDLLA